MVPLSFGSEEIDRHVIIFRQHTVPSEPELNAMRRNEPYVPEVEGAEEESVEKVIEKVRKRNVKPAEYLQKYEKHFGGLEVAKDAARTTVTNRSYGYGRNNSLKFYLITVKLETNGWNYN